MAYFIIEFRVSMQEALLKFMTSFSNNIFI